MVRDPVIDSRRVDALVQELRRYAPHYAPELSVGDGQTTGAAMIRIFAQLAEAVLVRLARAPQKHFVAFLDRLGITLLPARPASAPITFRLAAGSADPVRVPAGTRVTAQGKDGDIPFETTGELLAIPATLAAAYGVDPATDRIFAPPPGFLAQTIHPTSELAYRVLAFTPAGATRLQFDHATELQPGSMIRIDCRETAVVAKLDATVVTLEVPLARDVTSGAMVTPVRAFALFDGINRQEHAIYLGDPDLFAVKEEAYITVAVRLFETPGAGLTPMRLAWEFWTKPKTGGADAEERWQRLTVDGDTTEGLSKSGSLTLSKAAEEITEREVGGRKSRWIRALLLDPLPGGVRALPEIDTLEVSVQSARPGAKEAEETGVQADQGFHNATPLDLKVLPTVGFLPFGAEPRQFDQFYIASTEAFSKRGATVKLDFALDLQTLASPAAVVLPAGLRAYSIGLRRRLYELDAAAATWRTIGSPADLPAGAGFQPLEDSIPSAIAAASGDVYVFVNSENTLATDPSKRATKLWVSFLPAGGTAPQWIDLDAPAGARLAMNPLAVLLPGASPAFARVFAVSADGKLHSRDVTNAPAAASEWQLYAPPSGESWQIVSSPFVATSGTEIFAFVTGDDHVVHVLRFAGGTWAWFALTPALPSSKALSRPFAQLFGSPVRAKVFVIGETTDNDRKLFECTTNDSISGPFVWTDLGRPTAEAAMGKDADSLAPAGYVEDPGSANINKEGKHIFVRGADGGLHERIDVATLAGPEWVPRTRTGDPPLRDAAFVVAAPSTLGTVINVIAASARNSLVAWRFDLITGAVPASPQDRAVLLDSDASEEDDHYVSTTEKLQLKQGSTTDDRFVLAYDGLRRLARLEPPPVTVDLGAAVACTFAATNVGPAQADSEKLVVLHAPNTTVVDEPVLLRIDGDFAAFNFYSRWAGVASINLGSHPGGGETLTIEAAVVLPRTEFLSVADTASVPELSWEYWNGSGWLSLQVDDGTRNLLTTGKVVFEVPAAIQPTEVVGQQNFWIRARLVGGDYGRETFRLDSKNTIVSEKSTLRPPKVSSLRIVYTGALVAPAFSLTFNNLDYVDQTAASRLGGAHFRPFEPLESYPERSFSVFFGFDQPFRTGPIKLLIDAAEREYDDNAPPELDWLFRKDRQWKPLDADDGSRALTRVGILTLSAPEELTRESRFGRPLCWIRGSLRTDRGFAGAYRPLVRAILLNTVEAVQGETITGEIVGSSDGEPNQAHSMQNQNVLERQELRVQEALSAEERDTIVREGGPDAVVVREDLDGLWVRWRETPALFDAGPDDRCYLIDRAAGRIQFGDGLHGRIPPAGVDNIRAFTYRTGGGAEANVPAGKIDALNSAVAGIESVFNPIAAGGGSDAATTEAMLTIGPRRISHRDRAVSAADFEDLAREASREVAKVRCLAATNLTREGAGRLDPCDAAQRHRARPSPGWVSLVVVPVSADRRPCPSLQLRRAVKDFLRARMPGTLGAADRIVIRPPDYVEVTVAADIVVTSLEQAAAADNKARSALDELLHPLRGGPDGTGWEFGRPVGKSDVFSRLEAIPEIDRVENLLFTFRGTSDPDRVTIGPNELLASGTHQLRVRRG